jgi:nicotinamide-nucleotide amidase
VATSLSRRSVGSVEKTIGALLRKRGWTVSVAESCTGGLVSHWITNVSGSSDYFEGGVVSYSNRAKADHLRIPSAFVEKHGAVSAQVAKMMAEGVQKAFETTFGLSTTGVAGPTGGTRKTPVGLVFMGISDGRRACVKKEIFRGTRLQVKQQAAQKCLELFKDFLEHF